MKQGSEHTSLSGILHPEKAQRQQKPVEDLENFTLAYSPHITDKPTVTSIMRDVLIALVPACAAAIYFFGVNALITILVCVAAAVGTEALIQWLTKKPVTVIDLSAAVTGVLLALNLPAGAPLYVPIVGAVFAIGVCKQCFGGLGHNFINPALAARAMLMVAWPVAMTTYLMPGAVDAVASATPLAMMKAGADASMIPSLLNMAIGNTAGSMGETSAIALALGGIYLLARRVISWRIPVCYIATVGVGMLIFRGAAETPYQLLSGGLFLGAIFMATDYVSSPATPLAQVVYAVGCGILTCVIRVFGGYAEGVCFSILLMNLVSPLLERAFKPRIYGEVKAK